MKKKISAKILITQLVILCMTLFIFPMKVKADDVSASLFLYNIHHSYTEHNELIRPFLHQYDFYITANHEVSGRYIISISVSSSSTSHTWSSTAGEIYISDVMGAESGCAVEVTGQKDLIVTIKYYTDSPIDILNVRSIQFSQSDLDGNPITSDQSLWSYVQKIEDHEVQLLAQAGFINDQLTDTRQKLAAISTLLTTTNQTLSSLLLTATNILTKVTSIDTALQNIDKTIDTISWQEQKLYYGNYYKYSLDGNYINATQRNQHVNDLVIKIPDNIDNVKSKILYLRIPIQIGLYQNQDTWGLDELLLDHNSVQYDSYVYYQSRFGIDLYIVNPVFISVSDCYIVLKFNDSSIQFYQTIANSEYRIESKWIDSNDIEYWDLLGNINQYSFYKQQLKDNKSIIEKLSELILGNSTTNQSVSNNDQSNQQFNQQQQQYDQIESTFQSSFTTDQQAVQQTFSNNSLTIFADTALWFTQQLNALYNASGQMKILFTMPLLLGLALFFIGRGAKTSAPNTIDSYYSSEMVDNTDGVRTYHVSRRSNAHKVYHGFNRGKK